MKKKTLSIDSVVLIWLLNDNVK